MLGHQTRLDVSNINGFLTQSLVPYLGPAITGANLSDVICKMLDRQLYPFIDYDPTDLYQQLTTYGITLDQAAEVTNNLVPLVHRMIRNVFGNQQGEYFFDVTMESPGIVIVENLGRTDEQDIDLDEHLENRYLNTILDDIREGSWVPPKIRQAVGM